VSYEQPTPGPPPPEQPADQKKRRVPGTGMLIAGLIMLGVSVIGGIIAVASFAVSMVNGFTQFGERTHEITEHVTVDGLGDNTWYIYQDPNTMSATCSVLDGQGDDIVERSGEMRVNNNDFSLEAFQSFESNAGETYEIECSQYPVVLGGPIPFGGIIGLVISIVVSVLLFIAGLVLTIVGAVRRSRAKRPTGPPTPGAYRPGSSPGYGYQQGPPSNQSGQYPPHP